MKRLNNRHGFTLLEMAIVLGIIAIVTHLAVRETAKYKDMNRSKKANIQLDEIQKAIAGPNLDYSSGFYADMGRLPRAVRRDPNDAESPLTLSELWTKPTDVPEYADHTYDGIHVAYGWRGPYLRLPAGTKSMRDPWGNPIETPDDIGGSRLLKSDGTSVVSTNDEIAIISHFGADGITDSLTQPRNSEQTDVAITNLITESSLTITIIAENSIGGQETGRPATIDIFEISSKMNLTSKSASDTDGVIEFSGLKPGPHTLRIKYDGREWPPRCITLRGGHNTEIIRLSVQIVNP